MLHTMKVPETKHLIQMFFNYFYLFIDKVILVITILWVYFIFYFDEVSWDVMFVNSK